MKSLLIAGVLLAAVTAQVASGPALADPPQTLKVVKSVQSDAGAVKLVTGVYEGGLANLKKMLGG
jgi:hypothetical protein